MDSVHNMRVLNTDAKSHSGKAPEKCLQEAERGKKRIFLETCLQHRRHFSPYVTSVDGLLGVEATANLKRIASRLAKKWRKTYLRTYEYFKSRISITLVRSTHWCIWRSRVPAHWISVHRPQWEDGAGINLFRSVRPGYSKTYQTTHPPHHPPTPTLHHPNPINTQAQTAEAGAGTIISGGRH